jgi:hypothetical protein
MNNKLILGVQGLKKTFQAIVFITMSFSLNGKDVQSANKPTIADAKVQRNRPVQLNAPQRTSSFVASKSSPTAEQIPAPESFTTSSISPAEQNRINAAYDWFLSQTVWTQDAENYLTQDWNKFSLEQQNAITYKKNYLLQEQQRQAMLRRQARPVFASAAGGQVQSGDMTEATEALPGKSTFASAKEKAESIFAGAKERASAAASWGWEKGKEAYNYISSAPSALWDYESSLGLGTKLGLSATAVAATPYVAVALGSTGLAFPAAAVGATTYGLAKLKDRMEQIYKTKSWTESGAIKIEELDLEKLLTNSLAYPTASIKIEALGNANELLTEGVETNARTNQNKKARAFLINRYKKAIGLGGDSVKNFDKDVKDYAHHLRAALKITENMSASETKKAWDSYIDQILSNHNIAWYMAVLSEYFRAESQKNNLGTTATEK